MFETAVLSSGPQTKRVWTTLMGFSGQAALVTGLVLAPLISPATLPKVVWSAITLAPPAPPPPPPGPITQVLPKLSAAVRLNVFTEPTFVPPNVLHVDDPADAPPTGPFVVGAVPGTAVGSGQQTSLITGIMNSVGPPVPAYHPPVPDVRVAPPPAAPARPPRITVLQMAEPIQRVPPAYPPIARAARVSGTVELLGVLGTDGRIHEIKVLSGSPLLVKAAVDAVMQWVYRPTILNGQPVEVQAPISVRFILN
jgi:periplasmic protein TonB